VRSTTASTTTTPAYLLYRDGVLFTAGAMAFGTNKTAYVSAHEVDNNFACVRRKLATGFGV